MGSLIWYSQFLYLCFILSHFRVQCSLPSPNSPPHLCHPEEHFALLDFKNTISVMDICYEQIHLRRTIETWSGSVDCCLWEGITCNNMTGHVVGLDLSYSCIAANLTANSSLFRLEKLQILNLAGNTFRYPNISFGFHTWKSLTYLNLTGTGFIQSSLLFEIFLLPKLVSLDLSWNFGLLLDNQKFQMLAHNLTELRHLLLDRVNMSLVVPSSLLNLTLSLEKLSLSYSQLQGKFPSQVFHLPSLQYLDLSENQNLRGNLPKSSWSSPLKYLSLFGTNFLGELPHSLANLKLSEILFLYDCQFYGSIPRSFENLTEITQLDLTNNHLHGRILDVFGKMHKLSDLFLGANNFCGEIPISIFNLTYLTFLHLSSNNLTIPSLNNVSGLSNLLDFFMADNLLKGGVPSWLFSLPSLTSLDLSHNKLTDPIDHIHISCLCLAEVDLSKNKISGSIPTSFSDLVNLVEVNLSSNNLSGTITPNMLSKLVKLLSLDVSHNSLLSLSNNSTGVTSTFPELVFFRFSSCNVHNFPSFLMKARTLVLLDISNNKISGQVHKWEIEGMSLVALNLSHNFLIGIELFAFKHLRTVDLSSNLLQGSLPILSTTWDFMHLFISGNNLTGKIPSSYCHLTSFEVLILANNSLGGKIPKCFGNFSDLSVLDLRMNKFHGRIPNSFVKNSKLRTLNINGNQLGGILPPSLVNCNSLEVVDVGNNYLNDTFPHWLGVLPRLQFLILRSNGFHGPISNFMTALSFPPLRVIDISQNNFMGPLPSNFFKNLKAMRDVRRGKDELDYIGEWGPIGGSNENYYDDSVTLIWKGCKVVLEKIPNTLSVIDFSSNQFHGEIPEELEDSIHFYC